MTTQFHDRVVLVTGGGTGIGAAIARQFAQAGARVMITGRTEATLRASAKQHAQIRYTVADIAAPADAARAIDAVTAALGRLDVLVNNAGILEMATLAQTTAAHVHRTLDTNVVGLIETTRAALPLLRAAKGAIVNVTSIVADRPFANMSVYCASKAAVLALTRSWARELAADGIRVNAVSPGPVETPMFSADKLGISPAQVEQLGAGMLQMLPLKRFGTPDDVAHAVLHLASPHAGYATGAQYTVAGGMEA